MTTPITISIPHQLGRAEARRRIDNGLAGIVQQLPGGGSAVRQQWDGDRLGFTVSALGQSIACTIDVQDTVVNMEILLPGLLGMLAGGLKGRLQQAGQRLLTRK